MRKGLMSMTCRERRVGWSRSMARPLAAGPSDQSQIQTRIGFSAHTRLSDVALDSAHPRSCLFEPCVESHCLPVSSISSSSEHHARCHRRTGTSTCSNLLPRGVPGWSFKDGPHRSCGLCWRRTRLKKREGRSLPQLQYHLFLLLISCQALATTCLPLSYRSGTTGAETSLRKALDASKI